MWSRGVRSGDASVKDQGSALFLLRLGKSKPLERLLAFHPVSWCRRTARRNLWLRFSTRSCALGTRARQRRSLRRRAARVAGPIDWLMTRTTLDAAARSGSLAKKGVRLRA
eukprot:6209288-Pleurochrysis_carterae.AAC.7